MPALAALLTLGGCGAGASSMAPPATPPAAAEFTEFYADETVTGEASAPAVVTTGETMQLRLRLRNHSGRALQLTESTRCTVLRWAIIDAQGDTVQTMPNRPCAQQLATRALPPAQTIERAYQIPITVSRGRYILRFSFWNYVGEHAFEVR